MNNFKKNSGITLVALIITIIILLILAVVTIMSVTGDGIISKSRQAKIEYEKGKQEEEGLLSGYLSKMDDISSSQGENPENREIILKNKAYVGYYADVDADGTVDGVIYADLAIGNTGDGEWFNSNYTINKIDNVKDYYISQTNYSGDFGTKDVLCATGNGNERFYVMALKDFNPGAYYCWYDAAYGNMSDYSTATSEDFGTGKQNTLKMIEKWNNKVYGEQNDGTHNKDVWGEIQTKVNDGWFLPSKEEWSAFGEELGITTNNYEEKKLSHYCWSSSQYHDTRCVWYAAYQYFESMSAGDVQTRLLCTFEHDFLICKNYYKKECLSFEIIF